MINDMINALIIVPTIILGIMIPVVIVLQINEIFGSLLALLFSVPIIYLFAKLNEYILDKIAR